MFRIILVSGSIELYLTEIRSGSLMFVMCLIGVWQCNFELVECVCMVRRSENYSVSQFSDCHTVHTHPWFKIMLPNTDQGHDKHQ